MSTPSKNEKAQLLKDLVAGKRKVKDLNPVIFCEYEEHPRTPGLWMDKEGWVLTEEQMNDQIEQARKRSSLVWVEIRPNH